MNIKDLTKCRKCGETYNQKHGACQNCVKIRINDDWQKHLKTLRTLSIEERLEKVEEWIFKYKPYVHREMRF